MNRLRGLLLAVVAGAFLAGPAAAQTWMSGPSERAGRWETYGGLQFLFSESVDFKGGTEVDVDDDVGFAIGFGYNLNENLLLGGELSFGSPDYDADVVSDPPGDDFSLSGELDIVNLSASATWHFLKGPLTPYVSAMLAYTWIDTNIVDGLPTTECWWDPWWGYICDTFVDTKDEDSFSYGLGVGVRWDFNPMWFARFGYEMRWIDLDEASGNPDFDNLRIDIGFRF